MLEYTVTVNGVSRRISVLSRRGNEVTFEVGGKSYCVAVEPTVVQTTTIDGTPLNFSRSAPASATPTPTTAAPPGAVAAPIPGLVSGIKVKIGDEVKPGEVLLVLEAMKMENNISSSGAGTIQAILVQQGDQVRKGQILIQLAA